MRSARLLRNTMVLALLCFLGGDAMQSGAQVIYNNASTAQEGASRGLSAVISSAGEYNLNTSQAAINMTEAQRREMDNRLQWTETYYKNQEIGRAARAKERGPGPTAEQMVRFAQMGKPRPLSPSQFDPVDGRINWPGVLTTEPFAENRKVLDEIFAKRAIRGGIGFEEQMEIRTATTAMLDGLKELIREVPPNMYVVAKGFLQSLAYEGMKAI